MRDRAISERTPLTDEVTSLTYTSKAPADAQLRASLKIFGITGSAMDKVLPIILEFPSFVGVDLRRFYVLGLRARYAVTREPIGVHGVRKLTNFCRGSPVVRLLGCDGKANGKST